MTLAEKIMRFIVSNDIKFTEVIENHFRPFKGEYA